MPTIGRLAPSPTGAQHLGNARMYLLAWLSARSKGGTVRLRVEDIDTPRNKPDAVALLFDDFARLGLDTDGEPVVQSANLDAHAAALDELKRRELVYPCTCTRSDIATAAAAPHAEHEGPAYPGTCAGRSRLASAKPLQSLSLLFILAHIRASLNTVCQTAQTVGFVEKIKNQLIYQSNKIPSDGSRRWRKSANASAASATGKRWVMRGSVVSFPCATQSNVASMRGVVHPDGV